MRRSLVDTIFSDPASVSLTRFVSVPFELEAVGTMGYQLWAQHDAQVRSQHYPSASAPDGTFIEFDEWAPHEAAAAEHLGTRLFICGSF